MPVKPGPWAAQQGAVDPQFRSLWNGLYVGIPIWESHPFDEQPPDAPLQYFGDFSGQVTHGWDSANDVQSVITEFGPGFEWDGSQGTDEGIRIASPDLSLRGDVTHSVALLFKWDGTTGDEQALISQEGSGLPNYRLRIGNEASPAGLYMTAGLLIANAIVADDWYLVVMRPSSDLSNSNGHICTLVNLSTNERVADNISTSDKHGDAPNDIYFGAEANNDAPNGLTIAGAWVWHVRIGGRDDDDMALEAFLQDPFGMFRPAPWAGFPKELDTGKYVNSLLASKNDPRVDADRLVSATGLLSARKV